MSLVISCSAVGKDLPLVPSCSVHVKSYLRYFLVLCR